MPSGESEKVPLGDMVIGGEKDAVRCDDLPEKETGGMEADYFVDDCFPDAHVFDVGETIVCFVLLLVVPLLLLLLLLLLLRVMFMLS